MQKRLRQSFDRRSRFSAYANLNHCPHGQQFLSFVGLLTCAYGGFSCVHILPSQVSPMTGFHQRIRPQRLQRRLPSGIHTRFPCPVSAPTPQCLATETTKTYIYFDYIIVPNASYVKRAVCSIFESPSYMRLHPYHIHLCHKPHRETPSLKPHWQASCLPMHLFVHLSSFIQPIFFCKRKVKENFRFLDNV